MGVVRENVCKKITEIFYFFLFYKKVKNRVEKRVGLWYNGNRKRKARRKR